jgi:hypothetical protein
MTEEKKNDNPGIPDYSGIFIKPLRLTPDKRIIPYGINPDFVAQDFFYAGTVVRNCGRKCQVYTPQNGQKRSTSPMNELYDMPANNLDEEE